MGCCGLHESTGVWTRMKRKKTRGKGGGKGGAAAPAAERCGLGRRKMSLLLPLTLRFSHPQRTGRPKLPTTSSSSSSSFSLSPPYSSFYTRSRSSKNDSGDSNEMGDEQPTDWDKAWAAFRKRGKKKKMLSQFTPNKYVTWNPKRSEYPISEEFDPIRRTERTNLMLWTSPKFTLVGAIVIVSALLIYTILVPQK